MGKKKKQKTSVTVYGMSIHFGVCAGPVEYMSNLFVDEKRAWPATWPPHIGSLATYQMTLPDLFGGLGKEGGLEGNVTWLPGADDQVMPEQLAAKFGLTAATMPAYRGISSIFFWGEGRKITEFGGNVDGGFYWRANSPYLPGVWVEVARASEALEFPHARIWRDIPQRLSVQIAYDHSAAMGGTDPAAPPPKLIAFKAAMATVFDVLVEAAGAGMDMDIALTGFGFIESYINRVHATPVQLLELKSYLVDSTNYTQFDTNFDWISHYANEWFNYGAADTTIKRRVQIIVAAYRPTQWIVGTAPEILAAAAAADMADILALDGGTFNTAAGTQVYCYGANWGYADTQYTAYLVNTGSVPVIDNTDSNGLATFILSAIGLSGRAYDSNPAHIIYECLTNTDWGMGAPSSIIDVTSFTNCCVTLFAERFGLSMMWTQQASIEDFVTEVLDHIEATLFVNPRNGLLTLKLIRFDYSLGALPVFTPDNSVVTNFSRKLWGETINEIVVTWTNPTTEEEETVVAQDLANIEAQGGIVSDGRNYYGVRRPDLAAFCAQRDLRSASTPLAKCDLEVNRAAWALLPGDVCILNSPEDGVDQLVMRVGPVDYGKPGESTVRVSLVEDVWSLALADYTDPPSSLWVDESETPTPADWTEIVTLPYFVAVNMIDAAIMEGVEYPEVLAGVLAAESGKDTDTYLLYGETTNAAGTTEFTRFGTKTIASRATLPADIPAEVETLIASFPDRSQGHGPIEGGLMMIQGADEATSEVCLIAASGELGYTLWRGVLDTVPRAWPAGTPVWFIDEGMSFVDDFDIRAEGETVNYKVLTQTSRGTLSLAAAPTVTETLTGRPHYPLRPANVMVAADDGFDNAVTPIDLAGIDPIPVSWARRNRTTETALIKKWDNGDVTPEAGQTTTVQLLDLSDAVINTYAGLTGTAIDIDAADFTEPAGYIVVSSVRDGLESLQSWRVLVALATVPTDILLSNTTITVSASVVGTLTMVGGVPPPTFTLI